jgi:hypothetical protein
MTKDPMMLSTYVGIIFLVLTALYLHSKRPELILYVDKKGDKQIDYVILLLISLIVGVTASIITFFVVTKPDVIEEKINEQPIKVISKSENSSGVKNLI